MTDLIIVPQEYPLAQADQSPALIYLAGLAPSSRRTMTAALNVVARLLGVEVYRHRKTGLPVEPANAFTDKRRYRSVEDISYLSVPWAMLRVQHLTLLRSELAENYTPATANRILSALRGVLDVAFRLYQIDADDYQRARRVKAVRGETVAAGRALAAGEINSLLDTCVADDSPAGARDAAIVAILYGCGVRRAELVKLDVADITGASLKVIGKGRKERIVYLQNGSEKALGDWLAIRGDGAGPLFVRILRGGHLLHRRLTPQAVRVILESRGKQAGVSGFSAHDLRRTFAGDLLDAGADIATVQKLMGHSNVSTTARYDRRGEETKARAAGLLHVPYRGRK